MHSNQAPPKRRQHFGSPYIETQQKKGSFISISTLHFSFLIILNNFQIIDIIFIEICTIEKIMTISLI